MDRRSRQYEERTKNLETFGQTGTRMRGNGRGRGRGRGSYGKSSFRDAEK